VRHPASNPDKIDGRLHPFAALSECQLNRWLEPAAHTWPDPIAVHIE